MNTTSYGMNITSYILRIDLIKGYSIKQFCFIQRTEWSLSSQEILLVLQDEVQIGMFTSKEAAILFINTLPSIGKTIVGNVFELNAGELDNAVIEEEIEEVIKHTKEIVLNMKNLKSFDDDLNIWMKDFANEIIKRSKAKELEYFVAEDIIEDIKFVNEKEPIIKRTRWEVKDTPTEKHKWLLKDQSLIGIVNIKGGYKVRILATEKLGFEYPVLFKAELNAERLLNRLMEMAEYDPSLWTREYHPKESWSEHLIGRWRSLFETSPFKQFYQDDCVEFIEDDAFQTEM